MMGWLTRLFGQEGTVRFEYTYPDGTEYTGKASVELFNVGEEKLIEYLKQLVYVETGIWPKDLKIIAFAEGYDRTFKHPY